MQVEYEKLKVKKPNMFTCAIDAHFVANNYNLSRL